ncbi:MAG: aminopeptidase P family protein [Clostridia bacterium]|nr:aminopeptidase P family protein [Clostridia bacterium]
MVDEKENFCYNRNERTKGMIYTNGKKILNACGLEAVYTSCEYLLRYITGFVAENGFAVVDENGTTLYTDKRYIEAAEKIVQGTDVTAVLYKQDDSLKRLAQYKSVGVSFDQTSHSEYVTFEKAGVKLENIDGVFSNVMSVKEAWEREKIARACEIAEDAFLKILPEIKEGITESELAALLEYNMKILGASGTSFDTIVAFGAHASVPHYETGRTKLRFGDEILIDFGCKVDGYCSDITRTFLFGDDHKHEEFKKAYAAVLTAHNLVKERLQTGMTGVQADAIARDYLKDQGYGELFTHSLGHGIGLNIHEFPSVSPKGQNVLKDGMVFSDEPGVYAAGEFGIRIEDTVTLENGRVKSFMSKTDRNLIIL